jgi:UPF0716 protein FxsA
MRLVALFALVALAEMAAFFWVGSMIGLGWALGIAVATAVIGSILVPRAGVSVFGRFRRKLNEGVLPGREFSDGAAILVSGAFLISPGFITDLFGFLLLIPAVRDVLYRIVSRRLSGRLSVFSASRRTLRPDWPDPSGSVIETRIGGGASPDRSLREPRQPQ